MLVGIAEQLHAVGVETRRVVQFAWRLDCAPEPEPSGEERLERKTSFDTHSETITNTMTTAMTSPVSMSIIMANTIHTATPAIASVHRAGLERACVPRGLRRHFSPKRHQLHRAAHRKRQQRRRRQGLKELHAKGTVGHATARWDEGVLPRRLDLSAQIEHSCRWKPAFSKLR
eukprot:4109370-Pleurochrysis_carterae.AAC.3